MCCLSLSNYFSVLFLLLRKSNGEASKREIPKWREAHVHLHLWIQTQSRLWRESPWFMTVSEEGTCYKSESGTAQFCVPALLHCWKLIFLGMFFPGGFFFFPSSTQTSSFISTGSSHCYTRAKHSSLVEGVSRTPCESSVSTAICKCSWSHFTLSPRPV